MTYRNRALDGLRALAVAAVMLYHFPTKHWVPGGWIGVDVFFVLSGYLITTQLLGARARPRRAVFGEFYSRRVRRLLPALVVLLAVWLVVAVLAMTDVASAWPSGGSPTVDDLPRIALRLALIGLLVVNWQVALDPTPPGDPLLSLDSLWSLSLEEQFYLAWPPVVLTVGRKTLAAVTAGSAAVSAALPAVLAHGDIHQAQRVYFGTDTRCQALLIGALLAQLLPHVPATRTMRVALGALAGVGGLTLAWAAHVLPDHAGATRPLTFTWIALAAAAVVAYLGPFRPGGLLASRPLVWMGRRSYAIYLWQGPFAEWFGSRGPALAATGALATLVAAELSWRLVERRFLRSVPVATRLPA